MPLARLPARRDKLSRIPQSMNLNCEAKSSSRSALCGSFLRRLQIELTCSSSVIVVRTIARNSYATSYEHFENRFCCGLSGVPRVETSFLQLLEKEVATAQNTCTVAKGA